MGIISMMEERSANLAKQAISAKENFLRKAMELNGYPTTKEYILEHCQQTQRYPIDTYYHDNIPFLEIETHIRMENNHIKLDVIPKFLNPKGAEVRSTSSDEELNTFPT